MKSKKSISVFLLSILWLSCEKKLDIAEFEDEFGNYRPELKIEGLLQQDRPEDSIIRIIRTSTITEAGPYNGIDDNGDGRVDDEEEILAFVQDTSATVKVTNMNSGEETDFSYVAVADSALRIEENEDGSENEYFVRWGGYKPVSQDFQIEDYAQYRLEIYSREFDKTITGVTTVYPPAEFIDTLFTFTDSMVIMKINDVKEVFWKSDLDVTLYYLTFEEIMQIPVSESEYLTSYFTSRDIDLTNSYQNVSIGRVVIFFGVGILKLTVEALSPEYGRYVFSDLPLKDPQRSNLRDENGDPVMGCFGASAANNIFIVIEE
jgi:hypothetical protein